MKPLRAAIRRICTTFGWDHPMLLLTGAKFIVSANNPHDDEPFINRRYVRKGTERLLYSLLLGGDRSLFLDVDAKTAYYGLFLRPCVTRTYCFQTDPFILEALRKNESDTLRVIPEIRRIDDFAETLPVRAIKAPLEALQGAAETLRRDRPFVITDAKPCERLFNVAHSTDYRVYAYTAAREFIQPTRPQDDIGMLFLGPREWHERVVEFGTLSTERAMFCYP